VTEERTWVADPTLPWNILLHASLPHPPDTALLEDRLAAMSRHAGWPGVPPAPREADGTLGLLRSLADDPDGSFPVAVGVHGREVVVRAHHATLDGLGLVAALGWLLGVPVSSTAKGIGADRPAQPFLRGVTRRLGEVAFRPQLFDETVEGRVLIGVSAETGLAHARHQLAEGRVAREVCAQRQRVDEEADERLQLGARAAGDGRADDDVRLPRVACQQELEGREQRHEERRALRAAQRLKRVGRRFRERQG